MSKPPLRGLPPQACNGKELPPGRWAGQGFSPPTEPCPPLPLDALKQCLNAIQTMLADTLQTADLVPWIHPTIRSRPMCEHVQAIISTTAALNPVTNAAGIALQAALTVGTFVPPLLEMTSPTDFRTLYTLMPQQSQTARIASWGIDTSNTVPANLIVRVQSANTAAATPSPPNPFLSSHEVAAHQPTFILLQPDQPLSIQVAMQDLTSPALVDFGIYYWLFPVNKRIDNREGIRLRDGYGVDCR